MKAFSSVILEDFGNQNKFNQLNDSQIIFEEAQSIIIDGYSVSMKEHPNQRNPAVEESMIVESQHFINEMNNPAHSEK